MSSTRAQRARFVVAAVSIAGASVLSSAPPAWPFALTGGPFSSQEWPMSVRLGVIAALSFVGVLLIELGPERRPTVRPGPADDENVAASGERLTPKPELVEPMPFNGTFRGRTADIDALVTRHQQARAALSIAPVGAGGRPVSLFLHGMPGVGKSALANELARRLADEYPDGLLYANLGNSPDATSAAEVLRSFMEALGWNEPVPATPQARTDYLRTLTADRRLLVLLDGANHYRQVMDLLPSNDRCAVIVTSRRDLGRHFGLTSWRVGLPDVDDAIGMLEAAARNDEPAAECATRIVDLCGRLPLGIQSAGERYAQDGTELCSVAAFLDDDRLLDKISSLGRNLRVDLATEYAQLDPLQQLAFCFLGLVRSHTFVPWVLQGLMQVDQAEADELCGRLEQAQLIEFVGRDQATGLDRYQLHPLVRRYAREQLSAEKAQADQDAALRRLDAAYYNLAVPVAARLRERASPGGPGPTSRQRGQDLAGLVAANPGPWVRVEYQPVVTTVRAAFGRDPDTCWRLGVELAGVVPEGVSPDDVADIFDLPQRAAEGLNDPVAAIDVRIARARTLFALERYDAADRTIDEALDRAHQLEIQPDSGPVARQREAAAWLARAEAEIRMRRPVEARPLLQRARSALNGLAATAEVALVDVLEALNFDTKLERPDGGTDAEDDGGGDGRDGGGLGPTHEWWLWLARAEEFLRRSHWSRAAAMLDRAAVLAVGDARRQADLAYRFARLHLIHREAQAVTTPDDGHELDRLAQMAINRAAESVRLFDQIGAEMGQLRSRLLLARCLVPARRLVEAEQQCRLVEQRLLEPSLAASPAFAPVQARLRWSFGVVFRAASPHSIEWRNELQEALRIINQLGDGRAKVAIDSLLREPVAPAQRGAPG